MVRIKLKCVQKTERENGGQVVFEAVTGGSEENDKFWKYTPVGNLTIEIDNENAFSEFVVGKEYYLDISEDK